MFTFAAFQCFLSWSMAVFSRSLETTIWKERNVTFTVTVFSNVSYQHDPDEEEGVADEDEKNGDFTDIEVNIVSFKESTVFDNIFTTWIISHHSQNNPYCHVQDWTNCIKKKY